MFVMIPTANTLWSKGASAAASWLWWPALACDGNPWYLPIHTQLLAAGRGSPAPAPQMTLRTDYHRGQPLWNTTPSEAIRAGGTTRGGNCQR